MHGALIGVALALVATGGAGPEEAAITVFMDAAPAPRSDAGVAPPGDVPSAAGNPAREVSPGEEQTPSTDANAAAEPPVGADILAATLPSPEPPPPVPSEIEAAPPQPSPQERAPAPPPPEASLADAVPPPPAYEAAPVPEFKPPPEARPTPPRPAAKAEPKADRPASRPPRPPANAVRPAPSPSPKPSAGTANPSGGAPATVARPSAGTQPGPAAAALAPNWNSLLAAWLAANRRYPDDARRRQEQGEVTVRFTVGGDGRVLDVSLVKGSGYASLDNAAVAMLRGATLPAPGIEATRVVRVRYRLND